MAKGAGRAHQADEGRQPELRWIKPNPAFAIDRIVEKLVFGQYATLGWSLAPDLGNPYLTARCFLGRAVEIAKNADHKEVARRAHAPQDLLEEIGEIETAARVILNSKLAARLAVIMPRTESIDPEREFPIYKFTGPIEDAKAPLVKALEHVEEARNVIRDRPRPKQDGAKTFMTAFAEEMVYGWVRLTGKIPGPADKPLHEFVAEAFKTLQSTTPGALHLPFYVRRWHQRGMALKQEAIDQKKNGWAHQIRVATEDMAKRSEKDRADRYRKGFQPDGVGVQPLPECARRNFANGVPALHDQETRRLISVMNAGSEDGRYAASVLWTEYDLGSQQRRRRYEALGFNPADARPLLSSPRASDPERRVWRIRFDGGPPLDFIAEDHKIFGPSFAPDDD